jgi:type IX secretion system substrate protein/copper-binding protein NosD
MKNFVKIAVLSIMLFVSANHAQAATFTVTDAADTTAVNTLRWAIGQANGNSGFDTIVLSAGLSFSVATALPAITEDVLVEGMGNTVQATGNFTLFTLATGSDSSTLQNLVLNNSSNGNGTGIQINSNFNIITRCVIGTDWANELTLGFSDGINVDGWNNMIGGNGGAGNSNIISSNNSSGVVLSSGEGNSICGNVIGLNMAQDTDLGNGTAGIAIFAADDNVVGLPVSGWGNVISGNGSYGIYASTDNTTMQNNMIGPNGTETATFANSYGIYISSSSNILIGGNGLANAGNVVSGNTSDGIYVSGSTAVSIYGNIIGLNSAQTANWGNQDAGIRMDSCSMNTIGSPTTGWGNVICGNEYGIQTYSSGATTIQNNLIGLNAAGAVYANGSEGIWLYNSYCNLIGGDSSASEGNIISGNGGSGIALYNDSAGNSVAGNIIGLDSIQANDRGNTGHGIDIGAAGDNYVGLPVSGWGNVISGNDQYGINLGSNGKNKIQNNLIGTNSSGADFGNAQGIYVSGSYGNLIGGLSSNAGNVISGNNDRGIYLASGEGNSICGNVIGLTPDQSTALTNYRGIQIDSANNTIGLPVSGWGNVISGNNYGIDAFGDADYTTIQNNIIGLNGSGTAIQNGYCGIWLRSEFSLVGGRLNANHYERNVISGNGYGEVIMNDSFGSSVSGNFINTSLDGNSVIADASENEAIYISSCKSTLVGGSNADVNNLRGNIITGLDTGIIIRLAASSGNTVVGNFINVLADGSVPGTGLTRGILINNSAQNNLIGHKGTGEGNLIAGVTNGIVVDSAGAINNGLFGNTITVFSTAGIVLSNGGNGTYAEPVITSCIGTAISGTSSGATDFIEIFKAEPGAGNGGSLVYLGSTTASGGVWSTTIASVLGEYVCATASDALNNTSSFSANALNAVPTATPTVTVTHSVTSTLTVSATVTPTCTVSLTPSPTPTITMTSTASATATGTPSITMTPTITATPTISATVTVTPTISVTSTVTLTHTPTSTWTITATVTQTPDDQIEYQGKKTLAYPNPGKDQVTFAINVNQTSEVKIHVYNLSGECIAKITGMVDALNQTVVWNCADIAPGLYMVRIQKDGVNLEKLKIAIVK